MPQWGHKKFTTAESQASSILKVFDRMSGRTSSAVIASYSSSFSLATKFLAPQVRADISHLYAMVRIADELVDGTALAAGMDVGEIAAALDQYEQQVLLAKQQRFHLDPVLHAYGLTARRCDFNPEHIQAFFASMRRDLTETTYNHQGFSDYVYGSAEVIGLLCLDIFYCDHPITPAKRRIAEAGAKALGAAFQKINFLRDLAEDTTLLGRQYFPGVSELTEADKQRLIGDIRADLKAAQRAIALLPPRTLVAVNIATALYQELVDKLATTPAQQLVQRRIRISGWRKLLISARAVGGGLRIIFSGVS